MTVHETNTRRGAVEAAEKQSREALERGQRRSGATAHGFTWLQLASITGVETDSEGRWTGFLTVKLITMEGTRSNVKVSMPSGNGLFVGGPPEVNSVVVIGWVPGGTPIMLAQVPLSITALREKKGLPDLVEGEYLIRGGRVITNDDGEQEQVGGASILFDRDGRVVLEDPDKIAEVLIGKALKGDDNETDDVDPKTGRPVYMRCRIKDAEGVVVSSLYFDDEGNVTLEAGELNLSVDSLKVGDNTGDGDRLVTQKWVAALFDLHGHTSAAPASPTSGPITAGVTPTPPLPRTGLTNTQRSK